MVVKKTKSSYEKMVEKYGHAVVTAPMARGMTNYPSLLRENGSNNMKKLIEDKKLAGRHSPYQKTKKPLIVGIIGNMGSGKTTVGRLMVKAGLVNEERAFADKICDITELFKGAGYIDESRTIATRKIKQGIGLKMRELCEEIFGHREVWIDYVFNTITDDAVITDVRMPIEAERILKEGGLLVYLKIDDELRRERIEKRDNMVFFMKDWRRLHYHDTEANVKVIVKKFRHRDNFITVDASKSLDDIQIQLMKEFIR